MKSVSSVIELKATGVRFFSQGDEEAFFNWLNKLPFIKRCEGRGLTLYISVDPKAVDEGGLRELLAVFRRYGVELRQLAVFDRAEFKHWFCSNQAYWYEEVFGAPRGPDLD